ncbi:Uma2 family endonuclease [Streptomyces sp. URMC 124]|uniref:Uma2 family endonuclease n=1 Tax=Streptomyces sp. URMC 124 TaxID=3423405 RepID=UPI003F1B4DC2
MSTQARTYAVADPEAALKYALQRFENDQVQLIEGVIVPLSRPWSDVTTAGSIRNQLAPVLDRLGGTQGSGDLDFPGSLNWYVPDLAVVPTESATGAGALLPGQTLLVVEVTSVPGGATGAVAKRRRYAEYRAPLYLLVDCQEHSCTLFSEPGRLGYTRTDGPLPFGLPVRLPEPFDLDLDTSEF